MHNETTKFFSGMFLLAGAATAIFSSGMNFVAGAAVMMLSMVYALERGRSSLKITDKLAETHSSILKLVKGSSEKFDSLNSRMRAVSANSIKASAYSCGIAGVSLLVFAAASLTKSVSLYAASALTVTASLIYFLRSRSINDKEAAALRNEILEAKD